MWGLAKQNKNKKTEAVGGGAGKRGGGGVERLRDRTCGDLPKKTQQKPEAGLEKGKEVERVGTFRNRGGVGRGAAERRGGGGPGERMGGPDPERVEAEGGGWGGVAGVEGVERRSKQELKHPEETP